MKFTNKPLLADIIRIADGTEIYQKWFIIADGFVIVFDSPEDVSPIIYNTSDIRMIKGVHIEKRH